MVILNWYFLIMGWILFFISKKKNNADIGILSLVCFIVGAILAFARMVAF